MRSLIQTIAIGVSVLLLFGCGSGSERKATVKAGGKVVYENTGEPVTNVGIMFAPVGGGNYTGHGRLDAQGVFVLSTYSDNDGVPTGKYQVYFVAAPPEPPSAAVTAQPDPSAPPPIMVPPDQLVAREYLSSEKTPLSGVEIAQDRDNTRLEFKVKRPAK